MLVLLTSSVDIKIVHQLAGWLLPSTTVMKGIGLNWVLFSKFFRFHCSLQLAFEPAFLSWMLAGLVAAAVKGRRVVLSQLA